MEVHVQVKRGGVVFVVFDDFQVKRHEMSEVRQLMINFICPLTSDQLMDVMSLLILCCSRLSELQTVTGRVVSKNIIQHKDFTLQQTNLSGTNSLGSDGSRCENTFRLRAVIRSCVSSKRHTDNTTPPTNSLRQVTSEAPDASVSFLSAWRPSREDVQSHDV